MSVQLGLCGYLGRYIPGSAGKANPNALHISHLQSVERGKVYSSGSPEAVYQEWYWKRYEVDWKRWSPPKADLPCLYSNNDTDDDDFRLNRLSGYHKKQAECIYTNSRQFCEKVGLSRVGFLTLTFADNVRDQKEAYRRFKSMNVHFLSERFGDWILVKERQKRGAWHYHILIDCKCDIRSGVDFFELQEGVYSSANANLRAIWSDLRSAMPKYGFGRSELLPLRSNGEAVGRYVGKYISKHVGARAEEDKGVRLFSTSGGFKAANTKFGWNTPGNWVWRMKVKTYANFLGIKDYADLKHVLGARWADERVEEICQISLPAHTRFPTLRHWQEYHVTDCLPWWWQGEVFNFVDNVPFQGCTTAGAL
jgi:hypothetical protein